MHLGDAVQESRRPVREGHDPGHTHSPQTFIRISPVEINEQQMRCVVPILGTTNTHFMRRRPDAWDDSLAIVEVGEEGSFNRYLVIVG